MNQQKLRLGRDIDELEPAPLHDRLRREVRPRRRYLYEIEFFDGGHASMASAPPRSLPPLLALTDPEFDSGLDPGLEGGPRDPRLRELIRAAAAGWVSGRHRPNK